MAYDAAAELKRVQDFYKGDKLQKRFSALVTGETNAGKTFLLRTARRPVHIDSFDLVELKVSVISLPQVMLWLIHDTKTTTLSHQKLMPIGRRQQM